MSGEELRALFSFSLDPVELIIRGTAIYWFLFLLFRFITRRDIGAIGIADVLLVVLIADAAQNGMSGDYESISDGFVLVATIFGWNLLLDWAAFRFPAIRRWAEPPPLPLVEEGEVRWRNLRREWVTLDELKAKLREQGIEHVHEVKLASMESDGRISVIPRQGGPHVQQRSSGGVQGAR